MTVAHALRFSLNGSKQARHLRVLGLAILAGGERLRRATWCMENAAGDLGRAWGFAVALVEMPEAVLDDVTRN